MKAEATYKAQNHESACLMTKNDSMNVSKLTVVIAVLCKAAVPAKAQPVGPSNAIIEYNAQGGTIQMASSDRWHPPVGRPFTVHVRNVNRGAYRIRITAKDSVIATSDPAAFAGAMGGLQALPEISTQPKTIDTSTEVANAEAKKKITQALVQASQKPEEASGKLLSEMLRDNYSDLSSGATSTITQAILTDQSATSALDSLSHPSDTPGISSGKKGRDDSFDAKYKMHSQVYKSLKNLYKVEKAIRLHLVSLTNSISTESACINRIISVSNDAFLTHSRFQHEYPELSAYEHAIDSLSAHLIEAQTFYNRHLAVKSAMAAWQRTGDLVGYTDYFKEVDDAELHLVDEFYKALHVDSLFMVLRQNAMMIRNMNCPDFYEYTSPLITPYGDIVKIRVDIDDVNPSTSNRATNANRHEVTLYTKHRFRLDFSTGLGVLRDLADRSYYATPYLLRDSAGSLVENDSVVISEKSNRQVWTPMVAAFLHAGWDLGSAIKPALCLGLSLNTASLDLATILAGGSLILGRADRFVLSGGVAFRKVAELDGRFAAGSPYASADVGSAVPLENRFRTGLFLALSYNFTNKPVQK